MKGETHTSLLITAYYDVWYCVDRCFNIISVTLQQPLYISMLRWRILFPVFRIIPYIGVFLAGRQFSLYIGFFSRKEIFTSKSFSLTLHSLNIPYNQKILPLKRNIKRRNSWELSVIVNGVVK